MYEARDNRFRCWTGASGFEAWSGSSAGGVVRVFARPFSCLLRVIIILSFAPFSCLLLVIIILSRFMASSEPVSRSYKSIVG